MNIHLPCSEFLLQFSTSGQPKLPRFPGSAWRGALGHALKRTVCVVRDTPCARCMLFRSCAYPYIFETPPLPDAEKMRLYNAAPHPFVIAVDTPSSGTSWSLGLTLFGKGHNCLPYLIHALDKAGEHGIGKTREIFRLQEVRQRDLRTSWADEWKEIYLPGQPLIAADPRTPDCPPAPAAVKVTLRTPLRLRRHDALVTPRTFRFGDLFTALLRRISMLTYFHTETPLETDFAGMVRRADAVEISGSDLTWWDWSRYSSRQQTEMQMGGLLGSFWIDGSVLTDFWPYLWLGQWTHAGKAATMGLGRYQLAAASLPRNADPGSACTLQPHG
jgi:hypothetical protein